MRTDVTTIDYRGKGRFLSLIAAIDDMAKKHWYKSESKSKGVTKLLEEKLVYQAGG